MSKLRNIRKAGLWIIAGAVLAVLLGMNIANKTEYVQWVVYGAIVALAIWMVAMAIVGHFKKV